jgi:chaperonin GroES
VTDQLEDLAPCDQVRAAIEASKFDPLHDLLPRDMSPLRDNLLVKPFKAGEDDRTKGGLILPQNRKAERATYGVVLAVGPGLKVDINVLPGTSGSVVLHEHGVHPPAVRVGDIVAYPTASGYEMRLDDQDYRLLSERDILCVFGREVEATRVPCPGQKVRVEFDQTKTVIDREGDLPLPNGAQPI